MASLITFSFQFNKQISSVDSVVGTFVYAQRKLCDKLNMKKKIHIYIYIYIYFLEKYPSSQEFSVRAVLISRTMIYISFIRYII
jgi:hypothetical protein